MLRQAEEAVARTVKAFVDGAGGGELIRQRLSGDSLRESLIRWSF